MPLFHYGNSNEPFTFIVSFTCAAPRKSFRKSPKGRFLDMKNTIISSGLRVNDVYCLSHLSLSLSRTFLLPLTVQRSISLYLDFFQSRRGYFDAPLRSLLLLFFFFFYFYFIVGVFAAPDVPLVALLFWRRFELVVFARRASRVSGFEIKKA